MIFKKSKIVARLIDWFNGFLTVDETFGLLFPFIVDIVLLSVTWGWNKDSDEEEEDEEEESRESQGEVCLNIKNSFTTKDNLRGEKRKVWRRKCRLFKILILIQVQ